MKPDRFTVKVNGIVLFIIAAALVAATVFATFKFADKVFYSKATVSKGNGVIFEDENTAPERIAKYNEILSFIEKNYYFGTDENDLIEGAILGMTESLKDPDCVYIKAAKDGEGQDDTGDTNVPGDNVQTVFTKDYSGKIKYVRITAFGKSTEDEFKSVVSTMVTDGSKGLVLDLRDNAGGLQDRASAIADILLSDCIITVAKDKDGNEVQKIRSDSKSIGIPLVVLVNNNTSQEAEILAAAVKDSSEGTLIGVTTKGRAISQKKLTYTFDNSSITVTAWHYFTPGGIDINGRGVTPDMIIENKTDAAVSELSFEDDDQLKKALEYLQKG